MSDDQPAGQLLIDVRGLTAAACEALARQATELELPACFSVAADAEAAAGLADAEALAMCLPAERADTDADTAGEAQAAARAALAAASAAWAEAVGRAPAIWDCDGGLLSPHAIVAAAATGCHTILDAPYESDRRGEALSIGGVRLCRVHQQLETADDLADSDDDLAVYRWTPEGDAAGIAATLAAIAAAAVDWHALPSPAPRPASLHRQDVLDAATRIGVRLHPCRVGDRWLSVAELYGALCHAVARPDDTAIPLLPVPPPAVQLDAMPAATVDRASLVAAAVDADARLSAGEPVPNVVIVGDWAVSPGAFYVGLAEILRSDAPWVKLPDGPLPVYDAGRADVRRYLDRLTAAHPQRRWLRPLAINLCWTARPAD